MHGLLLLAALIASRERFDAKPNNSDFDWSSPPEVWDKLLPSTAAPDAPYVVAYYSLGEPVAVWELMRWNDGVVTVLFRGTELIQRPEEP